MVAETKWTQEARDRIHNLDLDLPEHQEVYNITLREFVMQNEIHMKPDRSPDWDRARVAAPDNLEKITVGIGFNMDRPEARAEWEKVFGNTVSFDDVYNKHRKLKDEEIEQLLDYSLKIRRQELERYYDKHWHSLKPNERLAIEDAYYNSPSLVTKYRNKTSGIQRETSFSINIKLYVDTGEEYYLKEAADEIQHHSNPTNDPGLKNRRKVQAIMLESYECPLYSRMHEPPIPHSPYLPAVLGKTIIPRDVGQDAFKYYLRYGMKPKCDPFITRYDENLYIWRTKHDTKVREAHAANDGKIFDKRRPPITQNPGEDFGCRCEADHHIPIWVEVVS